MVRDGSGTLAALVSSHLACVDDGLAVCEGLTAALAVKITIICA